jgi:transposase IS66 family protein
MAGRPPAVVELACWAHVRRKFYDVHQATRSPMAEDVQKRIGRLYDVGLDRHRLHDAEDSPGDGGVDAGAAEPRQRGSPSIRLGRQR